VLGRNTDFVVRADGTIMHALAVIYVLRAVTGVAEFKVVQHTLHNIEVLVVPDSRWQETGRAEIEAGLLKRMGDDVRIELKLVESIPAEASGKHRYVVSRVALSDDLKAAIQVPINQLTLD
jgi:phenylacetate-CoA ligase